MCWEAPLIKASLFAIEWRLYFEFERECAVSGFPLTLFDYADRDRSLQKERDGR